MPARDYGDHVSLLARWLADGLDHLLPLTRFFRSLEAYMSDVSDAIAEINTETDALAARVDAIVENTDDETAAQLRPIAERLRGIAADPANPVPPADGGDVPADPNA